MSIELASVLVTIWVGILTARGYLRTQKRRDLANAIRLQLMIARIADDEASGASQRKIAQNYLAKGGIMDIASEKPMFTKENSDRWIEVGMDWAVYAPFILLIFAIFTQAFLGSSATPDGNP